MKKLNLIFFCLLMLPCFIKADTYNAAIEKANKYMSRSEYINSYKKYLIDNSGALIDKSDYLITIRKINENDVSYLYDGYEYWAQNGKIPLDNANNDSNVRIVETVKSETIVRGTGEFKKPWIFSPINSVTIISDKQDAFSKTLNGTYSNTLKYDFYSDDASEAFINDNYEFISSQCKSYISFNAGKLIINRPLSDMVCNVELEEKAVNISAEFSSNQEEYIVPKTGYYKLEVWGAQGKGSSGYGGYSVGAVKLNAGDNLYINVGSTGASSGYNANADNETSGLGYNGGGAGAGGATHIAKGTNRGELKNYLNNQSEVLIVAGGGSYKGKAGGGYRGQGVSKDQNSTNGYIFGRGKTSFYSAAGGGWYGGNAYSKEESSGYVWYDEGGSGYIGNPLLKSTKDVQKAMYCIGCAESYEENIFTIKTNGFSSLRDTANCPNGYSANAVSKCAKNGDGYARITYLYKSLPANDTIKAGESRGYSYEGRPRTLEIKETGYYKLEVWGAQGKGSSGYGGYSVGAVKLNAGDNLYINVGSTGASSGYNANADNETSGLGYNGGGAGAGGATHIAKGTNRGELKNYLNNQSEVLIVAGGGSYKGKAGGGYRGQGVSKDQNSTNGYIFGRGKTSFYSAAGGGWYGGNAYSKEESSGYVWYDEGGSGYIGSSHLISKGDITKAMFCYNCAENSTANLYTIKTNGSSSLRDTANCPSGYSTNALSKCAKQGDGYAKITFISTN